MIVLSKKEAGPLPHAPTRPYPNPGRDPVSAFISSPTVTGPGAYVRTFGLLFSALRLVAGPRSSQQRKQRKNQDQDRINFQTSCRHGKGQDQPGECGKRRKAACWTAYSKSRSHIADAGIDSRDGALEILTIQSHENRAYGNQDKPEAEECKSLRDFLSQHRHIPRVRASTFCGCAGFWIFSFRALNTTRIRTTFTLPPVLPAMATTTIRKNRIILENVGQRPKSAVAYPVVVMTETTWNDAWQKAWDRPL